MSEVDVNMAVKAGTGTPATRRLGAVVIALMITLAWQPEFAIVGIYFKYFGFDLGITRVVVLYTYWHNTIRSNVSWGLDFKK